MKHEKQAYLVHIKTITHKPGYPKEEVAWVASRYPGVAIRNARKEHEGKFSFIQIYGSSAFVGPILYTTPGFDDNTLYIDYGLQKYKGD